MWIILGEVKTFTSVDTVMSEEEEMTLLFPAEFLNRMEARGIPQNQLQLKIGSIYCATYAELKHS